MLIKHRSGGYSLFELLIVLSFLGGMLVLAIQLSTSNQHKTRVELLVAELMDLKNSVYAAGGYVRHQLTPADLIAEQLYFGELDSPWGEPYRIEYTDLGIYVLGYAQNQQMAERVVKQLPAAEFTGGWVKLFVHQPEPRIDDSIYLHRESYIDRPYLNEMNTDLDMAGHNILNVGDISANEAEFTQVSVNTASVSHLQSASATLDSLTATTIESSSATINAVDTNFLTVSELVVAELFAEKLSISAPLVRVQNLQVSQLQGAQLTIEELSIANELVVTGRLQTTDAYFDHVSATEINAQNGNLQTLTAHQLNGESMFTQNFNANVISAGHLEVSESLQVGELVANTIFASDFVTATSSLVAVQKLAAKVESLWLQCTYDGGCR